MPRERVSHIRASNDDYTILARQNMSPAHDNSFFTDLQALTLVAPEHEAHEGMPWSQDHKDANLVSICATGTIFICIISFMLCMIIFGHQFAVSLRRKVEKETAEEMSAEAH